MKTAHKKCDGTNKDKRQQLKKQAEFSTPNGRDRETPTASTERKDKTYSPTSLLAVIFRSSSLDLTAATSMTEDGTLARRATFNLRVVSRARQSGRTDRQPLAGCDGRWKAKGERVGRCV